MTSARLNEHQYGTKMTRTEHLRLQRLNKVYFNGLLNRSDLVRMLVLVAEEALDSKSVKVESPRATKINGKTITL